MSILLCEKKNNKEDVKKQREDFNAVLRDSDNQVSLKKSLIISAAAHYLLPLSIFLLILLLTFLGFNIDLFNKPEPKIKDIEFVLINKPEQKPINKNTKLRSDRNSRAGGKHDPKRKVSDPEPVSKPSVVQKPTPPKSPAKPKASTKITKKPKAVKKPAPKSPKVPPRPVPQRKISPPKAKPISPFSIPVPVAKVPKTITPMGGPVTVGPIGTSAPTAAPAPIMASGSSSNTIARKPSGYSIGGGNPGNPSPGNINGRPGIDAIKEPDFGPYMRELQRRIKRNWSPPKGNESKQVVVLFRVSRDGRLLSIKINKSSGNPSTDKAALSAVKITAPFRPLPPEYRGEDIDIQFTFDYNVFGIGGRQF